MAFLLANWRALTLAAVIGGIIIVVGGLKISADRHAHEAKLLEIKLQQAQSDLNAARQEIDIVSWRLEKYQRTVLAIQGKIAKQDNNLESRIRSQHDAAIKAQRIKDAPEIPFFVGDDNTAGGMRPPNGAHRDTDPAH